MEWRWQHPRTSTSNTTKKAERFERSVVTVVAPSNDALDVPTIGLNLPRKDEKRVGTNCTNPARVKLIYFLLKLIYAENNLCAKHPSDTEPGEYIDVLILTKYKQQVRAITMAVNRISLALISRNKIKIAMVQAAQGVQASLVIIDSTRDRHKSGYIGQSRLANMAMARAQWGLLAPTATDPDYRPQEGTNKESRGLRQVVSAWRSRCGPKPQILRSIFLG